MCGDGGVGRQVWRKGKGKEIGQQIKRDDARRDDESSGAFAAAAMT